MRPHSIPNYGILYSDDGGVTFNALPNAPVASFSAAVNGNNFVSIGNNAADPIDGQPDPFNPAYVTVVSHDNGNTVSLVPITLDSNASKDYLYLYPYSLALGDDGTIFSASGISKDGGKTYHQNIKSTFQLNMLDGRIPSFFAQQNKIFAIHENGLSISSDGGLSFASPLKFSSNFCLHPVVNAPIWNAQTVGNTLFVQGNANLFSNDLGETVNTFYTPGGYISGFTDRLISTFGNWAGLKVSDSGVSLWSNLNPMATYKDPQSDAVAYNLPNIYRTTPYISTDGTNQLSQLSAVDLAQTTSAISIGSRIIIGKDPYSFETYDNGVKIYSNTTIGGYSLGIKIRQVGSVIFALGDFPWVSFDQGSSFTKLPSPDTPADAFMNHGLIYIVSWSGSLTVSTDGGHSFHMAPVSTLQ